MQDVGPYALELPAQEREVPPVRRGPDRAQHRQARDGDAVLLETHEIVLELRLAQRGRRHVHVESERLLPEHDVDEVPPRAADRALHHVQDAHVQ